MRYYSSLSTNEDIEARNEGPAKTLLEANMKKGIGFISIIMCMAVLLGVVAPMDVIAEENKLVIANADSWPSVDDALQLLADSQPGLVIERITLNDEQIVAAFLSGDASFDILGLDYSTFYPLAVKDMFAELGTSGEIMESLEKWLPGAYEVLYIDNQLCALPLMYVSDAVILDGPKYRTCGLNWPTDAEYSWSELAQIAQQAKMGQDGNPPLLADFIHFPWVIDQYISMQFVEKTLVNFDTPVFRNSMEAYKRMVNDGAIIDREGQDASIDSIGQINSWDLLQCGDVQRRMMPTLEGQRTLLTLPYVIAVNSKSEHMEIAMKMMEYLASTEAQASSIYQGLSASMLREVPSDVLDELNYTDGDIAYREMLHNQWIPYRTLPELYRYCNTAGIVEEYYNDVIDIDEFVRLLQAKADVIQAE